MPYTMKNLPDWLKNMPKGAQKLGIEVFNDTLAKTKDEDKARMAAWGAIKNKYRKDKKGKWVKKEAYNMTTLEKFMAKLITEAKSVWKTRDSEQNKVDLVSSALSKTGTFARDSWVHTLFPDVAIVRDSDQHKYFAIEYTIKGRDVTFGNNQEVEIAFIPMVEQKRTEEIEKEILNEKQINESLSKPHSIKDSFECSLSIIESKDGKPTRLKGEFIEADVFNESDPRRLYPFDILNPAIKKFDDQLLKLGLDGHKKHGGYGDAVLLHDKFWIEEGKGCFEAEIIPETDAGRVIQFIAERKIPIQVSLCGMGTEKYDKKKVDKNGVKGGYVVQGGYEIERLDPVLHAAFDNARNVMIQEEQQLGKEEKVNEELKKLIEALTEKIEGFNKRIDKLESTGIDAKLSEKDRKALEGLREVVKKTEELKEAKARVVELLESDDLKEYPWKETLNRHLTKCATVDEVNSAYPKVLETIKEMEGKQTKPAPTSVIVTDLSHSFFGDKKIPNTIDEAYKWCLDKFKDTGVYMGKSRLNNPRFLASIMLDNYLKFHIGGGSEDVAVGMERREIFQKNRRNPLFHLIKETIGDDEMASTDVAATAAYLLPLYVTTMQDMLNIVNQAVGVLPLPKPTGKIPFKKTYYQVSSGVWAEITPATFTRIKAVSSEGGTPLIIKIKTLTNTIALEDPLKLMYEWTIEAEQDLRAYYGLNVDSDTLQEARKEIMRELSEQILYDLLAGSSFANSDNCVQATGSPLTYVLSNPAGWSKAEWMKYGLTKAVKQADALINKQPHNVKADTIIVDAAYDYLFTEPQFVSEDKILTSFGFNRIGTYQAHYKVFTTTCVDFAGKILLLHRGTSITEAPHLFMPYILFWIGGKVEQATAEFSRTVMSRFATNKVYGQKIAVIDIV